MRMLAKCLVWGSSTALLLGACGGESQDSDGPPSCRVVGVEENNQLMIASLQDRPRSIETPTPRFEATLKLNVGRLQQPMIDAAEEFLNSPQYAELDTGHEILSFDLGLIFRVGSIPFEFEEKIEFGGMFRSLQNSAGQFFDFENAATDGPLGIKYSPEWEERFFYSAQPLVRSLDSCEVVSARMTFGDTELATFPVNG